MHGEFYKIMKILLCNLKKTRKFHVVSTRVLSGEYHPVSSAMNTWTNNCFLSWNCEHFLDKKGNNSKLSWLNSYTIFLFILVNYKKRNAWKFLSSLKVQIFVNKGFKSTLNIAIQHVSNSIRQAFFEATEFSHIKRVTEMFVKMSRHVSEVTEVSEVSECFWSCGSLSVVGLHDKFQKLSKVKNKQIVISYVNFAWMQNKNYPCRSDQNWTTLCFWGFCLNWICKK